ncbi:MAG TPA: Uma2 family endonuclease [Ktedonobacteraceae bacterium]|nr:Uma2 family endonuclease [Ktedonobacteraceae bacterium]
MYEPMQNYSLEEYWKLVEVFPERKYEYVDGNIRMMTGGSPAHGQIGARIAGLLDAALRGSECNVYSSDVAVRVAEQRLYYPDISVSCDPHDWTRKKALEAPTVVVEVLSPTTERIDKSEKLEAYKQLPSIQEILFVDSQRHHVEHYHRIGSYKWEDSSYKSEDDVIDLASIEVSLTVHDIYFKVYLELEEAES